MTDLEKRTYDQIIVSSDEKVTSIVDWFIAETQKGNINRFHSPFERGAIIFEGENAHELVFDVGNGRTHFEYYNSGGKTAILSFWYDHATSRFYGHTYPKAAPQVLRNKLAEAVRVDRTDLKETGKYLAIMAFAQYYTEYVTVDESKTVKVSRHDARKAGKNRKSPVSLVRKCYVISDDVDRKALFSDNGRKRRHRRPDHEVAVRGHFRRYKTGKTVWVRPHSRYKNAGTVQPKQYMV